ncbi:MAG: CHAT domain-containing protein [Steroidobacteraceae bacterium]
MSGPTLALPVHRLHDEEVERLLATGERRAELKALFGDKGYRELSALARRAAARRGPAGTRVYVLPGLMGSRIGSRGLLLDDVLWVDLIEIAAGHLTRLALPAGSRLVALGAMLLNTLKLKLSLRIAGFDAQMHPYDWRASVSELADALNRRIAAAADGSPVMLVGHSMGGLVARLALGRQRTERITRVVQLGAPNHGSFAPVLALRGVYPTVRKLAAIDRRHTAEDLARIVFRTLPALHELLPDPALVGGDDLFDANSWPNDPLRPDPERLLAARQERERWPGSDDRCLVIAGVRQETVTSLLSTGGEFDFGVTPQGDGTVPLALAVRPGERAWYVGEKHGGLPNNGRVIAAVVDLLRTGATQRLAASASRSRMPVMRKVSETVLRRVAPHKVSWQHLSPDARRRLLEPVVSPEFHGTVEPAVLERAFAARSTPARPRRTLEVRLVRGSITDASSRALVLGVFHNVDPSGPAAAIDAELGGAIREFTLRRMFAAQLGQVFVLPVARSRLLAEFVLCAGLGDFADFGADATAFVAENVVRTFARTQVEDFATVLFGAGSGVPVAMALEQQLRGFIAGVRHADPDEVVRRISICEIDARKYAALVRAARDVAAKMQDADLALLVDEVDAPESAPRQRPARMTRSSRDAAPRDPAYLLVSMTPVGRSAYECRSSLLTAGAKAAVLSGSVRLNRADLLQHIEPLESGAATARDLARIGTALAGTLLSTTVREGLEAMHARPLVIVHDREASRVPWEVLRIGTTYPALGGGLSRRYASDTLSVARWREDHAASDPLRVLLIVDPTRDLPGAAAEGEALRQLLGRKSVTLDVLTGRDATRTRILAALGTGAFDVLHFAGHAFFDAREPDKGGLVCDGKEVLRGADLAGVGNLPALVFCNACEAARVRKRARGSPSPARLFGMRRTMTGIAEAFLAGGVANFLGTHWPVGDDAAFAFSQSLYESLLTGDRLGDAVLSARRRLESIPSIDWADYVHYGSTEFRFALVP